MGADSFPVPADPVAVQVSRFAAGYGVAAGSVDETWEALRRAGVAQPGLAFASWVETVALAGLLTPIVANCPDVATALAELARFHPLLERDRIVLTRGPQSVTLTLRAPDGRPAHDDTVAAFFAVLCRMLRRLAGDRAVPSQVTLRRARSGRDAYAAAFGVPAVFSQPADSCRFGATALQAPIGQADPAVRRALLPHAQHRIARRRAPWSAAVSECAAAGTFGLAQVAGLLAVSPRTLQSRLEDEGTSFAAVIAAVRKERAQALLAEPGLPISVIAARTGFATPSAFTRAFRRWTGQPPSLYRRTALSGSGQQEQAP
jgi:AraC-like DNA-binding protein